MPGIDVIIENLGVFAGGFLRTLQICLYAAIGSLVLGTVIAAFRVSPFPPLRWVGTSWVTVFRNCPLTVVLFFSAFGLPEIGINGAYYWFGVTGLVLYTSAFVCEAVRSGINSISAGQAEAARAIGLTFPQVPRPGRAAAGTAHRRAPTGQRDHRYDQELGDRWRVRRRR